MAIKEKLKKAEAKRLFANLQEVKLVNFVQAESKFPITEFRQNRTPFPFCDPVALWLLYILITLWLYFGFHVLVI